MSRLIDTSFDFTSDTPHYWENFWQNCDGLGCGSTDPDSKSPKLRKSHKLLLNKLKLKLKKLKIIKNLGKFI